MTQTLLAFIIIVAFVTMIAALMVLPVPAETSSIQLINTFMGLLAGMAASVVSYYFGSSTTSKTKDETIQRLSSGTGNGKSPPPKTGDPGTVDVSGTATVKGVLTETK